MEWIINSENELPKIAEALLTALPKERIFAFYGEMGAGKTTLIKECCKVLEVTSATSSPTFAIVNEYITSSQNTVYHFDFYRIQTLDEARQIGFEDYLNSGCYCFIEWTENVEALLDNYVKVYIKLGNNNERIISYIK